MDVAITAIGLANPPYKCSQKKSADIIAASLNLNERQKRRLFSVFRATGIDERYSVLSDFCKEPSEFEFFPSNVEAPYPTTSERMRVYKQHALNLALKAISNIENFDKNKITHVITVSCTGMYAPGIDIEIVQHLKLNPHTQRTTINFMGCYGAFNGLKIAKAICHSNSEAKVLLVCVELCTIHFQKNNSEQNIFSNAIFSDGAAAVLVETVSHHKKYLSLESFHCDLIPQTSDEMTWAISDSGFDIVLSSYVPEVIRSGISQFVKNVFIQSLVPSIDLYAIHPGGMKILKACEESLQISREDNKHAYSVLRQFGNMSSATILFVLKSVWNSLTQEDHLKTILSCAFGPGLTLETMFLRAYV